MRLFKELLLFPGKIFRILLRRIVLKYFLHDFNMASLYLLTGVPLFLFGTVYGIVTWIKNASMRVLTPAGTVVLVALAIIMGFQLILQAIQIDINQSPKSQDK